VLLKSAAATAVLALLAGEVIYGKRPLNKPNQ